MRIRTVAALMLVAVATLKLGAGVRSAAAEPAMPFPGIGASDAGASGDEISNPDAFGDGLAMLREAAEADDLLRRMIGQMIMVGFQGDDERDAGVIGVRDQLAEGVVGGVVLYPENIHSARQLRLLTACLANAKSELVPLIAVAILLRADAAERHGIHELEVARVEAQGQVQLLP